MNVGVYTQTNKLDAQKLVVGWREWVSLPQFSVERIKAKVDTGARTSALHAFDIVEFKKKGESWIRFNVHPMQRDDRGATLVEMPLVGKRKVRDSGGRVTVRPVIETTIRVGDQSWIVEITLVNRDTMGFRMLLGRQALRGHLLVDSGRSFLLGKARKRQTAPGAAGTSSPPSGKGGGT